MISHLLSEHYFFTSFNHRKQQPLDNHISSNKIFKKSEIQGCCRNLKNRHLDCKGEQYEKRDLSNATNDNQLLKPETVRQNNQLKSKPAVSRYMKKLIISNFIENRQTFYSCTPMQPIYDQFLNRYEQKQRDREFQHHYFNRVYKHHLSKAIQYTLSQVLNFLSFDDIFKVNLDQSDFHKYLQRQPKLLRNSVSSIDLFNFQQSQFDNQFLTTNRKIQLITNVFQDPHFNAQDRQVLYQVIIFQIKQTQKSLLKLEKASNGIKALNRFQIKKESHLEQLTQILDFMQNNYDKLVKLI
ncbi:unnamed protein product [Paramecium sonneborni]|uniref:Uncharacterized protein n=1 Tax=Paramecium sonneborni TaxID=65129 RepID=A0A8S1RP99_9CILI|nr:unnamed protein product [Paramecium sonneborni]